MTRKLAESMTDVQAGAGEPMSTVGRPTTEAVRNVRGLDTNQQV